MARARPIGLHASAALVGAACVLLRGPSGSGKSQLALALTAEALRAGRFGRVVGDDRILVRAAGGRLLAAPAPSIAGLVERRGLGLTPIAHEAAAVVRLVVDLHAGEPPRLPEPADLTTSIAGVMLPRLPLRALPEGALDRHVMQIMAALALFGVDASASP
jgi:serine kinase of HPr protein (carbohydrate metabolism regulator)